MTDIDVLRKLGAPGSTDRERANEAADDIMRLQESIQLLRLHYGSALDDIKAYQVALQQIVERYEMAPHKWWETAAVDMYEIASNVRAEIERLDEAEGERLTVHNIELRHNIEALRTKILRDTAEIERLKALSQNNAHSWDAIVKERNELRAEVERLTAEVKRLRGVVGARMLETGSCGSGERL